MLAFGFALVAAAALLLVPMGTTATESSDGTSTTSTRTLLESEGGGIVVILLVPVAVTAVAVLAGRLTRPRPTRLVLAALMCAGCVLAMLSIGIFVAPAAITLLIAATRTPPGHGRMGPQPKPLASRSGTTPRTALPTVSRQSSTE